MSRYRKFYFEKFVTQYLPPSSYPSGSFKTKISVKTSGTPSKKKKQKILDFENEQQLTLKYD